MTQEVLLRAATQEDAPALARLAYETFFDTFGHLYPQSDIDAFVPATFALEIQAHEIADPATVHQLAMRGKDLVGYVKAGAYKLPFDRGARRALEIHRLYVVPDVKGLGVADQLMR